MRRPAVSACARGTSRLRPAWRAASPPERPVTVELLSTIDRAEAAVRALGFGQLRCATTARRRASRSTVDDLALAVARRRQIVAALRPLGYRYVTLDLEGFRSGSTNGGSPTSNFAGDEAGDDDQLLGRLPRRRAPGPGPRAGRRRPGVGGRGLLVRLDQPDRLPRRQDVDDPDRHRDHQRVLAHRVGGRPDGGRVRLRHRRALRARSGGVGTAGDRGLPRRPLRQADGADHRLHQRVPARPAPAGGLRRADRARPVAAGRGHRPRQG